MTANPANDLAALSQMAKEAQEKQAVSVERGDLASRLLAGSLGQVGNTLGLVGPVAAGARSYKSPVKGRDDHEESAELMDEALPEALGDTKLRLGGSDFIDDAIWKSEGDESLPWYKQIGGRIGQNPRTSILGKLLGYGMSPIRSLVGPSLRTPFYDGAADVVNQQWDDPAMTRQLLGMAADKNKITSPGGSGEVSDSMIGRQIRGLGRDAYSMATAAPLMNLIPTARGAGEVNKAIEKGLPGDENAAKRDELNIEKNKTIPAVVGATAGTPLHLPGVLAGLLGGKAYGMDQNREIRRKAKKRDADSKPKDGDGDGQVNDGTPQQKAANFDAGMLFGLPPKPDLMTSIRQSAPWAGIGAGIGAGAGAVDNLLQKEDERENILRSLLRGGVSGGIVGGGAGMAKNYGMPWMERYKAERDLRNLADSFKFGQDKQAASNCKVTGSHPKVKTTFDAPGRTRKYVKAEKQGQQSCWKGYKSIGKKKGKNGKMVNDCVKAGALPVAPAAEIPQTPAGPPAQAPATMPQAPSMSGSAPMGSSALSQLQMKTAKRRLR